MSKYKMIGVVNLIQNLLINMEETLRPGNQLFKHASLNR